MLEPVEETDSVFVEPSQGKAPSSGPPQPAKEYAPPRPVPPIKMRMRIQKVKRPISHNIPPPPNIPLPPPPVRRKVQSESDTKLLAENKPTLASLTPEESTNVKPPLKPKPAILPKPVHLAAAVRRHSESNVAPQHSEESSVAPVPTPRKISKGPKPPPPTRTSSLSETRPLRGQRTSPLPSISDVVEETDSAEGEQGATAVAALRMSESKIAVIKSNPPERPPPPRPRGTELDKGKRKSDPAVRPPLLSDGEPTTNKSATLGATPHATILFDASMEDPGQGISRDRGSAGSSLKAKGSNLMRSLKKMVKRSDSRKEESEKPVTDKRRTLSASDEGKSKPPRPSQPPKRRHDSQPAESKAEPSVVSQQQKDSKTSPVPKPRAKPHVQETSETSKQDEPEAGGESGVKTPPPRPPPPGSSENGEAGGKKKDAPSRPPPPKLQNSQQKGTVVNGDISVEINIENGPKPSPHPRNLDQTSSEEGTDSKPVPKPRKSVSPPPSSPVDSSRSSTNFYRAMKDYKAQRDAELTFSSGDILIKIDSPSDEFYYGMLDDGTTGLFPVGVVEPFRSPS